MNQIRHGQKSKRRQTAGNDSNSEDRGSDSDNSKNAAKTPHERRISAPAAGSDSVHNRKQSDEYLRGNASARLA